MIYTIISAVAAFIATNTDDLFINILLYVRSSGKKEDLAITAGKFTVKNDFYKKESFY